MIQAFTNQGRIFLTAIFFLAHQVLTADTIKTGGNVINETWTTVDSPYIVQGDLIVPAGSFLTIGPGVEVRFASTDSQVFGRDAARVELIVRGELRVQGTAASPVRFKGQTATAGSWYGVIFTNATVASLSHLSIQDAINGLVCETTGTTVQVNDLVASSNQTAVAIHSGTIQLDRLQAYANQTAIRSDGSGLGVVKNAAIHGNSIQGIHINSSSANSISILSCTIHSNAAYGIHLASTSQAAVNVRNSVITGNSYGIYRSTAPAGSATVSYSDVWGNSSNTFNTIVGTGVISADPLYIDADGADNVFGNADDNLRLQPNSPCGYADEFGTDMGAYEIAKLVITQFQFIGDDAQIRFTSISNRIHQLQSSEDLMNWMPVGAPWQGTGGLLNQTDSGVRNLLKRFYRVRLEN